MLLSTPSSTQIMLIASHNLMVYDAPFAARQCSHIIVAACMPAVRAWQHTGAGTWSSVLPKGSRDGDFKYMCVQEWDNVDCSRPSMGPQACNKMLCTALHQSDVVLQASRQEQGDPMRLQLPVVGPTVAAQL